MKPTPNTPIVFYDGLCGLCDKSVQFILKHDSKKIFLFSALQSDFASNTLNNPLAYNSFILNHNGKTYQKSTAALHTLKLLGGFWTLLFCFIIVPPFIRDAVYDFIAANRFLDCCSVI